MNDAGELWRRVSDNRDKLDACPRHLFEPLVDVQLGVKVECLHCGGKMDLVRLNFYIRGYEAAGKSGNDILPNWKEPSNDEQPMRRRYFKGDAD